MIVDAWLLGPIVGSGVACCNFLSSLIIPVFVTIPVILEKFSEANQVGVGRWFNSQIGYCLKAQYKISVK